MCVYVKMYVFLMFCDDNYLRVYFNIGMWLSGMSVLGVFFVSGLNVVVNEFVRMIVWSVGLMCMFVVVGLGVMVMCEVMLMW